jgi:hypothetical protein
VIASHYAEPVPWKVVRETALHAGPRAESEALGTLEPGEPFLLVDESLGWAWGYARAERRVGYARSESLEPQ